ncbi:hypothetical protein AYI69_g4288, partial [Smittium culicis]
MSLQKEAKNFCNKDSYSLTASPDIPKQDLIPASTILTTPPNIIPNSSNAIAYPYLLPNSVASIQSKYDLPTTSDNTHTDLGLDKINKISSITIKDKIFIKRLIGNDYDYASNPQNTLELDLNSNPQNTLQLDPSSNPRNTLELDPSSNPRNTLELDLSSNPQNTLQLDLNSILISSPSSTKTSENQNRNTTSILPLKKGPHNTTAESFNTTIKIPLTNPNLESTKNLTIAEKSISVADDEKSENIPLINLINTQDIPNPQNPPILNKKIS